jgi:4-hydroxy-2-oxoheptanedioate aldolase
MTMSARLGAGRTAFGMTMTIADPFLAEIISSQPLDFVVIDVEHAPFTLHDVQTQLIAMRTSQATQLVRVAHNDEAVIGQVLDIGAHGVVVPHVETADDLHRAVAAAVYPPRGRRGFGPRRAARLSDRDSYVARANDSVLVVAMIESALAVENLDVIVGVEGLSGVIIGSQDLAASLGHLNDVEHPQVVETVHQIMQTCRDAAIPFGMYAASSAATADLMTRGAQIITLGSDLLFFEQGMRRALDNRPIHSTRGGEQS